MALNVVRMDGFDSAIEVNAESLPTGITATPAVIDHGELSGMLALSADATAPAFSAPTWRVVARPLGGRSKLVRPKFRKSIPADQPGDGSRSHRGRTST